MEQLLDDPHRRFTAVVAVNDMTALAAIDAALERSGLLAGRAEPPFHRASFEQLARVHEPQYIEALEIAAAQGGGWIDNDTYVGPDSVEVAALGAGMACAAVDAALRGDAKRAFVLAPASSCFCTSGPNSHRLDSATRRKPSISGATVANISPATPRIAAGICSSSMRLSAALIMPIALWPGGGGIDAWPGRPFMRSTTDM